MTTVVKSETLQVKLTTKMKQMLDDTGIVWVGTTSKDGVPNISPRTAYVAVDDGTLVWLDYYRHKTYWNFEANPSVTVGFADVESVDGYQLKGKVEIVTNPPEILELIRLINMKRLQSRLFQKLIGGRLPIVVRMKIDEIYSLKPVYTSDKPLKPKRRDQFGDMLEKRRSSPLNSWKM